MLAGGASASPNEVHWVELVCVLAFGASWLAKGLEYRRLSRRHVAGLLTDPATPAEGSARLPAGEPAA